MKPEAPFKHRAARRPAAACSIALLAALQGCANTRQALLGNPTPLHAANPAAGDPRYTPSAADQNAEKSSLSVATRYYAALEAAQASPTEQAAIDRYVAEGVALIELQCLRWFGRLEDAQRNLQVNETNRNVITQLGTTVIGLAKLKPIVTSAYGAVNTTVTGFNANFDSAFLAAPNAENVKRLTLDAIGKRAAALQDAKAEIYPKGFSAAYLQLEKLANQCTFAEVKRLTTKTVDQAQLKADPVTGEAIVFGMATSEQATTLQPRIAGLLKLIDALSAPAAINFALAMPQQSEPAVTALLKETDPKAQRTTDDAVARAMLKRALVLTAKSDAVLAEWETVARLINR